MEWVYLSPHLDDAVLSCGGIIQEQIHEGDKVTILTTCAGDPPAGELSPFATLLHSVWQTKQDAVKIRREEDAHACQLLGAAHKHFNNPDCIYRFSPSFNETGKRNRLFFYTSSEALFETIHPKDKPLIDQIVQQLKEEIPSDASVVSPLAIGNHVDHQITRAAAEKLDVNLSYYADFPYAAKNLEVLNNLQSQGWVCDKMIISEIAFTTWINAVSAYRSQISSFWADLDEMQKELRDYYGNFNGICLWKPKD
jgi:LmbE family N-acetylglucosaminyl deacetylase